MTERYNLSTDTVPTIPTPHDCVIKDIAFDDEWLILTFKQGTTKLMRPEAESLIIRIHLYDPLFFSYENRINDTPSGKGYYLIDNQKLTKLCNKTCEYDYHDGKRRNYTLEYLYHYVGYQSIIIKLYCGGYYMLDITSDYIEFDWIE